MILHRISYFALSVAFLSVLCTLCHGYEEDAEPNQADYHSNKPRFFRIYSRPHPDAEKQVGVGLTQHLKNVLNGGTIGIHSEFRPWPRIQGLIDKTKRIFPQPNFPPWEEKQFPDKDTRELPKDNPSGWKADMESEEPDKSVEPGQKDPPKPDENLLEWEDVGEEKDTERVPIEEIIQPRRRPKRFAESHVYHVPLEFVSNARPYQVKIRHPNTL